MKSGFVWGYVNLLVVSAVLVAAQPPRQTCACGKHPPTLPADRTVAPYAGEPHDMSPYAKFADPYFLNYTHPNLYTGSGRDIPDPKDVSEVRIGFFGPIEHNPDSIFGLRMLHGAQLAIEEANALGGYGGKPFRLMLHNDYDNWQAKAVYGDDRPTDPEIWGASSNEAVKMIYDDNDWAIFGSISSESTHIVLRVALKAEIPIVNSASTDPTIPETYIPWYFTDLQDDRAQCLTLARRIFTELGLKRVALLRINNRYGRFGVLKFRDVARRLGHPVVIEQKFLPGDVDFSRSLKIIRESRADAIVLWGDESQTAGILKQMKSLGMKQRVFGSYRTIGPELLANAGDAAEGFEAVFPYDPTRQDPGWLAFNRRFEERFHEKPEQFASLAYDAMNALLDAICKAGLNRARIHDELVKLEQYDGVTGHMIFDPNQKNVAPLYLAAVHAGAIRYRVASMDEEPKSSQANSSSIPYARVGEEGVAFHGPRPPDASPNVLRVVVFGKQAEALTRSEELTGAGAGWELIPVSSDQNWGAASTQIVSALWDKHALAVVALDRDAAHLAEQLAIKAFVPVIALSEDKSLTSANVPWIFRMPQAATPADALRILIEAEKRSGANAERLRDVLASGASLNGVAFLSTGEPRN